MQQLPHELYTAEQTRQLDKTVIETHRIPGAALMARAGAAALELINQRWPQAEHLAIVCGSGNNGGDGYELGAQARQQEMDVAIFEIGKATSMSDETRNARAKAKNSGVVLHTGIGALTSADVIVDCLFGTGLNRDVEGDYTTAIEVINHHAKAIPVLSLDIPSGISADSGRALGCAVHAHTTLSFLGLNRGLFTGQAPDHTGEILFDSLAVPVKATHQLPASACRLDMEQLKPLLAPRPRTAHKGMHGHLLVLGGDAGMPGAVRLAGEAASRVGAGLVSIGTHPAHAGWLSVTRPELMSHAIDTAADLKPLLKRANAVTVGPGLGQRDWGHRLLESAMDARLPMVVDADGLNLLSQLQTDYNHWILTPHPGEAARLLQTTTAKIEQDRFAAVRKLQQRYGGIVVLKGAGTLIDDGQAAIRISSYGNPGMGSGGMGDVLAGVIGGLLAQKLSLREAACVGVALHGMAADKAAGLDGERGMLALDLMSHLRRLANLID